MNQKWLPKTREGKLGRLLEEAGEVILELGKIQRFGLDTRFCKTIKAVTTSENVESNREALLRELADLQHAIAEVEEDLS